MDNGILIQMVFPGQYQASLFLREVSSLLSRLSTRCTLLYDYNVSFHQLCGEAVSTKAKRLMLFMESVSLFTNPLYLAQKKRDDN